MTKYSIYEVDLQFKQVTGATIPVTAQTEEQARAIAGELFENYEAVKIDAVRDLGFSEIQPDTGMRAPEKANPSKILMN